MMSHTLGILTYFCTLDLEYVKAARLNFPSPLGLDGFLI